MSRPAQPLLSVCICTHNARRDYLERAIAALAAQSLAKDRWELLLVDNRSDEAVADWLDLAALPNAHTTHEHTLGLTHARLRAIREARGELLVFVDDDNVLEPDYLEQAARIMAEMQHLGAVGGRCLGEFERRPPIWMWRYRPYMAVVDHGRHPIWGHRTHAYEVWFPVGAGMVVRKRLAEIYASQLEKDPTRREFGRRGERLTAAEDTDLVYTVMDTGYGVGYFPELTLKHLIPAHRLRFGYLKRLIYHSHYSAYRLLLNRGILLRPKPWPLGYLACIVMCTLQHDWHPLTWLLALQVARGKYACYHDYMNEQREREALAAPAAVDKKAMGPKGP